LAEDSSVFTESEGEGMDRRVVIFPKGRDGDRDSDARAAE
jgi:hypothetical protein